MGPQAPNFGALLALRNEQSSEQCQNRAPLLIPQSGLTAELSGLTQKLQNLWVLHQCHESDTKPCAKRIPNLASPCACTAAASMTLLTQKGLAQGNKRHTHFRFSCPTILSDSPVEMRAKTHLGHEFSHCWNWHQFPWGHAVRRCVTPCAS